jgi:hypothetical protein
VLLPISWSIILVDDAGSRVRRSYNKVEVGVSAPVKSNMKGHKMKLPHSLPNKKSEALLALFPS